MPRKANNWKKFNFYMPPRDVAAARVLADYRRLTVADVVRAALKTYLLSELPKEKHVPTVEALLHEQRPE